MKITVYSFFICLKISFKDVYSPKSELKRVYRFWRKKMSVAEESTDKLVCGTLKYTVKTLIFASMWLMLGGMTLALCAYLPGRLLPIQLLDIGATDAQKSFILSIISGVLNMIVCPIVGYKSDRYRSRFGRRIPFILMSLPFFSLALFLFGCTGKMGGWIANALSGIVSVAPTTMTILLIGVVMFIFQFANMYVNSVFWYIFNDVIPPQYFGRVMGVYRVGATAGVAIFNYFVFQYAKEYFNLIFICASILYAVGMGAMCFLLKEGEYPPVGEETKKKKSIKDSLHNFLTESCCSRFYIYRYTLSTISSLTGCAYIFTYYFNMEMGLNDKLIGRMDGISGIITFVLTLVLTATVGFLVDRWHPMRICTYYLILNVIVLSSGWCWMFVEIPGEIYAVYAVVKGIGSAGIIVLFTIASLPMQMLIFPKSRFGSFCSAQALIRAAFHTLFGLIVGLVFDFLKTFFPGEATFHYRAIHIWAFLFSIPTAIMAIVTYREWGRLGGYKNYKAPASWNKEGYEEVKQAETRNPNAKLLKAVLYGFDVILLFSIIGAAVICFRAGQLDQISVAKRICYAVFPCQALMTALWIFVRIGILRDIARCLRGEQPKNGIIHHGMLLFLAVRQFITTGTMLGMAWFAAGNSIFIFLLTDTITNIILIGILYLLTRMEKGIVSQVETVQPDSSAKTAEE